ncbi:hypothetical protein OUY22_28385 [Nonomuraea sp. MCN248]|uniref:SRPBCC domain-containing protein n=1 Tax=Nonomuraea corallina TaxID=2989783 RepID=A0ABT4SK69_9ACTN|nr:hypothetical protein [Nonomuraea corallina]MDA0637340.1 hypothetical protein [Nonomuraea corallina]
MSSDFRIERESELPAEPEDVWQAVTRDSAAWSIPLDLARSTVLVWEPPHRGVLRTEIGDWFNQIAFDIAPAPGGSYLRYVHSGVFVDDWENEYEGARRHTDVYLHTLGQYLRYFRGRKFRRFEVLAPKSSITHGALGVIRAAWGIAPDAPTGSELTLPVPGAPAKAAVLDLHDDAFIGVRTEDALYRVFGRNRFGSPVALGVYEYGVQARPERDSANAWAGWLRELYGTAAAP